MILQPRSPSARRRSAFTLLEVLVVVAIILVLASVATVAVLQIQSDNKADTAKMNAINLEKALKEKRNDDAVKLIEKLNDLKKQGHDKFVEE